MYLCLGVGEAWPGDICNSFCNPRGQSIDLLESTGDTLIKIRSYRGNTDVGLHHHVALALQLFDVCCSLVLPYLQDTGPHIVTMVAGFATPPRHAIQVMVLTYSYTLFVD